MWLLFKGGLLNIFTASLLLQKRTHLYFLELSLSSIYKSLICHFISTIHCTEWFFEQSHRNKWDLTYSEHTASHRFNGSPQPMNKTRPNSICFLSLAAIG